MPRCVERLTQAARRQDMGPVHVLIAREQEIDVPPELHVLEPIVEEVDVAREAPFSEASA